MMAAADCPNFLPFDLTGSPLERIAGQGVLKSEAGRLPVAIATPTWTELSGGLPQLVEQVW